MTVELLIDGKNAFPEIIRCIEDARESIFVNMFIWRNDTIGNAIARSILSAADRGVKITVVKDRYGVVCECCEENKRSFFHRKLSFVEKVKSAGLELVYNKDPKGPMGREEIDSGELLRAVTDHPNITLSAEENRYDHSKFYVFDNKTLIFGGINIEDKENGRDYRGREYRDYMVKLTEEELVSEFLELRRCPGPSMNFGMNIKEPVRYFAMKEAYLRLIEEAEQRLDIVMAYISPMPEFMAAILSAADRGVETRIVIPAKANFQDDLNKKTVKRLIDRSGGRIKAYAYPGMLHAKLLISEKTLSLGSCNITKKAFGQLDELNFLTSNGNSDFSATVADSVEAVFAMSEKLKEGAKYDPIMAALESILM